MFNQSRNWLKEAGFPEGDAYELPTSRLHFEDGAHYRVEVPTVNSVACLAALHAEAQRLGVFINRVTETYGMQRHCASEIREYVDICRTYGSTLLMSIGPRAAYDTGATAYTPQGATIGYRLRGQEQVVRAVEDVLRGIELGVRGFVIYDEGLLTFLHQIRLEGKLPSGLHFKVSAHCGHCNPLAMRLLQSIGADSINPARDLQLPMIAALRATVSIPLDIHVDNPPASGGFIRTYEAPEIVRIAAPVYLKAGNSVLAAHGTLPTAEHGKAMARQVAITIEMLERHYPTARTSRPLSLQQGEHHAQYF